MIWEVMATAAAAVQPASPAFLRMAHKDHQVDEFMAQAVADDRVEKINGCAWLLPGQAKPVSLAMAFVVLGGDRSLIGVK